MTIRAYDHYMHTGDWVAGIGAGALMGNLRGIIAHCLVNGSGGVPAAGWYLEYDEGAPNGTFVLANGDRSFFVCFSYVTNEYCHVSIAASFEGVNANGFIVGESARSGAGGEFSSPSQLYVFYMGGRAATELGRSGWSMLADADSCSFVFSTSSASSYSPGVGLDVSNSNFTRYGGGFSFGKTTKGFGYFSGLGTSTQYTHPASAPLVINDPRSGLLIASGDTLPQVTAGVCSGLRYLYAQVGGADTLLEDQPAIPLELYMQPAAGIGGGSLGLVRGFLQMPFISYSTYPRQLLRSLGMADDDFDTMRVQDLARFRMGGDGYRYAYSKLFGLNIADAPAQVFLTDNPMVW